MDNKTRVLFRAAASVGSRPRAIYWSKLPRLEKKIRVAIDGALDVFFAKDFVQYLDQRSAVVAGIGDPGDAEHGDTPDRPGSAIPATTEIAA